MNADNGPGTPEDEGLSYIIADKEGTERILLKEAIELLKPTLIRYGQLTSDEFFITEKAAKDGVTISNHSNDEEIVILKHFAGKQC